MATMAPVPMRCTSVLPEEGERIRVFDEEFLVKVMGAETAGAYAVLIGSVAPGGGPPLHAHPGNETFYVLSGEFAFTQHGAGGVSTFRAGPGVVVHAPGGAPHRFENVGPARGTMLAVVSADSVDFVRELGAAFPPGTQPDLEKMLAIHAKYAVSTYHGGEGSRPEPPKDGATSARARALAWRYAHATDALIATVQDCTPEQSRAICPDTGWTVGAQARHVAVEAATIAGLVRDVADGQAHSPVPPAMLDEINAHHAKEFANATITETIALLRENGARAAATYRRLSDEQLARATVLAECGPIVCVADLIEQVAIGELERHGESIRRAISR